MKFIFAVLIGCFGVVSFAQGNAITGFRTAVTQKGLSFIADTARDIVAEYFSSVQLPEFPFDKDGFEGSVTNIKCPTISVGDITLDAEGGVDAAISGVSLACSADWNYKLKIWPHIPRGDGSVDISAAGGSASVDIALQVDSEGHAQVNANNVNAGIGDLDLHFHGGITSFILNLLKDLFSGLIRKTIEKSLEDALTKMVNTDINKALALVPVKIPIKAKAPYNISLAHVALTGIPETSAEYVGAGLAGYISPIKNPNAIAPYPLPSLPNYDSATADKSYIQLLVSAFTVESAIWTYQSNGLLERTILPGDVPAKFPFKLNTNDPIWLLAAPGLPKAYPNKDMDLVFSVGSGSEVSSSVNDQAFSLSVPLVLVAEVQQAAGAQPVFSIGCPLQLGLKVFIEDAGIGSDVHQVIAGSVEYLECNLALQKTLIGPVQFALLKDAVDIAINTVLIPIADEMLKTGFPIPIASGIELTNTTVSFGNDYVSLGSMAKIDFNILIPVDQRVVPPTILDPNEDDTAHTIKRSHSAIRGAF